MKKLLAILYPLRHLLIKIHKINNYIYKIDFTMNKNIIINHIYLISKLIYLFFFSLTSILHKGQVLLRLNQSQIHST